MLCHLPSSDVPISPLRGGAWWTCPGQYILPEDLMHVVISAQVIWVLPSGDTLDSGPNTLHGMDAIISGENRLGFA